MALKIFENTKVIIKARLFDWNNMSFGMKNATISFSKTMDQMFESWKEEFI
jgi:hypothetical protein